MEPQICVQHPGVAALFYCDGCGKRLCQDCIRKGHALLFCTLCGERALPIGGGQTVDVRKLDRRLAAASKPYSFQQALSYPFRGASLLMFVATLISLAFVSFLLQFSFGPWPLIFASGFLSLMVGLQLRIVRSTVDGDDDLPDWPEYADRGERFLDILTYAVILLLQAGPAVAFARLALTSEPGVAFWAGISVLAWIGTALGTAALGAAGRFARPQVLRVDRHLRALWSAGADALSAANLVFAFGILLVVVRALLRPIPFLGAAATGTLGAWWTLTSSHLAGVLFRRHLPEMEKIYE